jgi:hypothetical protein
MQAGQGGRGLLSVAGGKGEHYRWRGRCRDRRADGLDGELGTGRDEMEAWYRALGKGAIDLRRASLREVRSSRVLGPAAAL